jgi:hypothetical protein
MWRKAEDESQEVRKNSFPDISNHKFNVTLYNGQIFSYPSFYYEGQMKKLSLLLYVTILLSIPLLAACAATSANDQKQSAALENGQIQVVVFDDKNANDLKDEGEAGVLDHIGLTSGKCAATKPEVETDTKPDGTWVFSDLQPGWYCVSYMGDKSIASKMEVTVDLTRGGQAPVSFSLLIY